MSDRGSYTPEEFHLYLILPFLHTTAKPAETFIVEHSALARYYPNENEAFEKIKTTFEEHYPSSSRNFESMNECAPSSSMQFRLNQATRLRSESLLRLNVKSHKTFSLSGDANAFESEYTVESRFIDSILGENAPVLLEGVRLRFHELGVSILTGWVRVRVKPQVEKGAQIPPGDFRGLLEDILQRAFYHKGLRKWVTSRCEEMNSTIGKLDNLSKESVIQEDFKMLKSKGPFRYGHVVTIFGHTPSAMVDDCYDPLRGLSLGGVNFEGRASEFLYQVDMSTVENACPPTEGFVYVGNNRSLIVYQDGLGCIDNIHLAIPNTVVGAILSCIRRLIVDWMTAGTLHELLIRKLQLYSVTLSQQDEPKPILTRLGHRCKILCGKSGSSYNSNTSAQPPTNRTPTGLSSSSSSQASSSNGAANDSSNGGSSRNTRNFRLCERLSHCFKRNTVESPQNKDMSDILNEIEWLVLEVELYQSTMSLYRSVMMPITSRAYRMVHENLWRLKDSEASYERSLRALKTLYVEANAKMDRKNQRQQNRSVFILTILFLVPTVDIFYDLFAPSSDSDDPKKGGFVILFTALLAFLAWFISGFGLQ